MTKILDAAFELLVNALVIFLIVFACGFAGGMAFYLLLNIWSWMGLVL